MGKVWLGIPTTWVLSGVITGVMGASGWAAPAYLDPAQDPQFTPPSPPAVAGSQTFELASSGQRSSGEAWTRILATYRFAPEAEGQQPWWLALGHEWYETWGSTATQASLTPIQVGTSFQFDDLRGSVVAGWDFRAQPGSRFFFQGQVGIPLTAEFTPELSVGCRTHRAKASSIADGIYACRLGLNLFYPWSEQWSSFVGYRYGSYSDDNHEHQIIGSLTYATESFSLGGNLFSWSYGRDTPAYFSPPDFLVLMVAASVTAALAPDLACTLALSLGQQRLTSQWSDANTYEGRCDWQLDDQVELASSLKFSNVQNNNPTGDPYNSAEWGVTLRWLF
ncbi:MAG: hypothetical protein OHK0012_15900 [Synechococcales cyanobacterium]